MVLQAVEHETIRGRGERARVQSATTELEVEPSWGEAGSVGGECREASRMGLVNEREFARDTDAVRGGVETQPDGCGDRGESVRRVDQVDRRLVELRADESESERVRARVRDGLEDTGRESSRCCRG